jgi:hypothetical protein
LRMPMAFVRPFSSQVCGTVVFSLRITWGAVKSTLIPNDHCALYVCIQHFWGQVLGGVRFFYRQTPTGSRFDDVHTYTITLG